MLSVFFLFTLQLHYYTGFKESVSLQTPPMSLPVSHVSSEVPMCQCVSGCQRMSQCFLSYVSMSYVSYVSYVSTVSVAAIFQRSPWSPPNLNKTLSCSLSNYLQQVSVLCEICLLDFHCMGRCMHTVSKGNSI